MLTVKPFRALRPRPDLAGCVAALPYDVMETGEARAMVQGNPYSFLHVDRAEIDLDPQINPYDDAVYRQAKINLETMIADGVFLQDATPCYYIYRLKMDGHFQTGLVCCPSIDDYLEDRIKKHEFTRAEKESDRIRHVDALNANTGPIFLAARPHATLQQTMDRWVAAHPPLYDFVAEDGVGHTAWQIGDAAVVAEIEACFQEMDALYIADGHHRAASAVKVGQRRRKENAAYTGQEAFNFFLSVVFPSDQLRIMDYNRVVADLNGYSAQEFLQQLERFVRVELAADAPLRPEKPHVFGMYLAGRWHRLSILPGQIDESDPVARLDVSFLQDTVLEQLLGIVDPRTDNRIDFIGGIRGLQELEQRVDSGEMAVAFSLYPSTLDDLMAIADAGRVMPPKSTWFEPKLRSGLFIHRL